MNEWLIAVILYLMGLLIFNRLMEVGGELNKMSGGASWLEVQAWHRALLILLWPITYTVVFGLTRKHSRRG